MRCASGIRRALAVLLVAVALTAATVTSASADPTSDERRKTAEDVAATICKSMPHIPKLPAATNPQDVCRSVIIENVDPEGNNSGVRAACELALPIPAKPAARYCVQVLDRLLDPARQLFLDKVVPAAQQLACVTTAPAAFDCLAQQVHVWLKQSIMGLWQALITSLTADTAAIGLLDQWRNAGIVSLYGDVGAVAATVLLGLVLTSLIISLVRLNVRRLGGTLLGVVMWGIFWSGGAVIAVLLLKASDATARWLAGRPGSDGQTALSKAGREFGDWVDYVTGATATGQAGPVFDQGSFTAILICLLLIVAILVALVSLLLRNVALLLITILLPITLAGSVGPTLTRQWFGSAVRLFVALLLAKPLIVVAFRLGAVLVSVPKSGEPRATVTDALLGVAIILLAGLLPGVIYRFSGGLITTQAGAAPRASGGLSGQSAQSLQSSMDMTWMIMERNAPRPMFTAGSGVGGSRASAAGLGSAAGPIGVAAAATAVAGGAMESGGRWLAGQAATAGGVLGDVEAPHVPGPPVSRLPYPAPGSSTAPTSPTAAGQAGRQGQHPVQLTIVPTTPPAATSPVLPPSDGHLVIPGSVEPPAVEPTRSPRALPGREADDE